MVSIRSAVRNHVPGLCQRPAEYRRSGERRTGIKVGTHSGNAPATYAVQEILC